MKLFGSLRALTAAALLAITAVPACTDGSDPTTDTQDVTASTGKFELYVGGDGQHYFQLLAKNGKSLLQSQAYTTVTSAKKGIASVKTNGALADQYTVIATDSGEWYFSLKAGNGQVIGASHTYATKDGAQSGVKATMAALANASTASAASGAKFETFKADDGKYYFRLRADNGQVVLDSQGYTAKSSAQAGISSVTTNGVDATKYQIVTGADGQSTFRLIAGNNQVIANGEMYASKSNAFRGSATVRDILREMAGVSDATLADVLADLATATDGVTFTSESDFPFTPVSASLAPGETITQSLVRSKFAGVVDADPATDKPLASLYGMEQTWQEWKDKGYNCWDPSDPVLAALCSKTRNLEQVLEADLSNIHVYFFGKNGSAGNVQGIAVTVLVVGVTPDGQLAGVRTIAIWT